MLLPGDKVLVFFLVPSLSLQAHFGGPYSTLTKVGDREYLVVNPDRL